MSLPGNRDSLSIEAGLDFRLFKTSNASDGPRSHRLLGRRLEPQAMASFAGGRDGKYHIWYVGLIDVKECATAHTKIALSNESDYIIEHLH